MVNRTNYTSNVIIYIFLFDICVLPTFHIASLPFKIAYLVSFIYVLIYISNAGITIGGKNIVSSKRFASIRTDRDAKSMVLCAAGIILVTILGEITLMLFTRIEDSSSFRNAIFFYIVLLGSLVIGYSHYNFNKDSLVYIMGAYCGINIVLSALGTAAPLALRQLYYLTGEREAFYFSNRPVGTMANPNATLCVMNMLFMSIITFIRKDKIDIKNKAKLIFIMLTPLVMNCFINSRGEFLVTAALEMILLVTVFQKHRGVFKTLVTILFVIALGIVAYNIAFGYLAEKYPTVAYSINRIMTIFEGGSNLQTDSISDRPFIHWDEFIARFLYSPIWGTGFSVGSEYPFQRSCQSYHNDWFRIFASGGIIGAFMWLKMIIKSIKKCGLYYILPFIITAISNSFIGSIMALSIYFITVMSLIRYDSLEIIES